MKTAFLQLHTAIFLAGFTGILGRLITLNEGLLVWYRLLITTVVLWLIFFFSNRKKAMINRWKLWKLFAVGAIVALHWVFFYGSIKYANVSIALVCFSSVGFFTAIIEPLLFQKKTDAIELILGLLVIAGIYLIFHFDPQFKTGIVLGIMSSILAAWFTVLNKKLVAFHDSHTITLFELSGGWIAWTLLLPIYLYNFPSEKLVPGWSDFVWLIVLSVFCTVLAFNLAIRALQKINSFTVNLSYNLEPLYGILLAFVVYKENEHLDQGFFLGLGLIMLAVVLQSLRIMKKPRLVDSTG